MLSRNDVALKEREDLCGRLARGEQLLLVRKGGILEVRDGFRMERREFFLFPTRFHARGEAPPERVTLTSYATVVGDVAVADPERLRALQGLHGLTWEEAEHHFHYGREPGVHAILLRVWSLARPETLEDAGVYDGCRSWVTLESDRPVAPGLPALPDEEFRTRLEEVRGRLDG
jgi:hypothetical protein